MDMASLDMAPFDMASFDIESLLIGSFFMASDVPAAVPLTVTLWPTCALKSTAWLTMESDDGVMAPLAIAFLPIGDHYTMGPEAAARACRLLGVRQVVPMHYGTFPILTGPPERLKQLVDPLGIDVLVLKPGETAK